MIGLKQTISFLLVLSLLGACVPCYAVGLSAQSAVLYDPLQNEILYEKAAHDRRSVASTTKIMTALVALELYDPMQTVTIERAWTGIEGSSMYLKPGERLQIIDLLYGLMLMSGNDAAVALASLLTGDMDDFVALMNRKAQELGLADTAFANPNGLENEGHYSTAYDMARLMAAAMENELFCEIVGTASCMRAGRQMNNHNKLLGQYAGCVGGKTGYTRKAGRCLVTAAERQGRQLIAVTLGAPDDWADHAAMYEDAFSRMIEVELCAAGTNAHVPVADGQGSTCALYVEQGFSMALLPEEAAQIRLGIHGPRMVYGPVQAGGIYGYLTISLGDRLLFRTPLYYKTGVRSLPEVRESHDFWQRFLDRIIGSAS